MTSSASLKNRLWLKRAYDVPGRSDGQRILVDRLWPRGVSKSELKLDDWMKDIAPSDALRRWFGHDVDKWEEFRKRYTSELDDRAQAMSSMHERLAKGRVTLVYAAKDKHHTHALVLKAYLERDFDT